MSSKACFRPELSPCSSGRGGKGFDAASRRHQLESWCRQIEWSVFIWDAESSVSIWIFSQIRQMNRSQRGWMPSFGSFVPKYVVHIAYMGHWFNVFPAFHDKWSLFLWSRLTPSLKLFNIIKELWTRAYFLSSVHHSEEEAAYEQVSLTAVILIECSCNPRLMWEKLFILQLFNISASFALILQGVRRSTGQILQDKATYKRATLYYVKCTTGDDAEFVIRRNITLWGRSGND